MHEVGNVDEQKVSLRALVTLSRNGEVRLSVHEAGLRANGEDVPLALTGVRDVAAQMSAQSILGIRIGALGIFVEFGRFRHPRDQPNFDTEDVA